jgi:hypothetical protein
MKHLSKIICSITISFFILMAACAPATAQITPIKTHTSPPEIIPRSTKTLAATSIPTENIELNCPKVNPNTQFNLPTQASELETSILNYLNSGGNPTRIQPQTKPPEIPPFYSLTADIDGDSLSEVVVSTPYSLENPATIRIYHCGQHKYHLAKSFGRQDMSVGITEFVTNIFPSEPDFIVIRVLHTSGWAQDFVALGWQDAEWRIIKLATGFTPSEIAFFDQNMDGIKEVLLETRTAATPGGGRSRAIIDIYSWNGTGFAFLNSVMPPDPDRIHYLQDAESAWENGNPLLAITYCEIAARDTNITSYWTTYELIHNQTELAESYQKAFAFFRIIAIWFYLDRPEVASEYIQEMSEAIQRGKPGSEFVMAAQELSKQYEINQNFSSSCMLAVKFLDSEYPGLVQNHLGDWGVANPTYFATADICKLGE